MILAQEATRIEMPNDANVVDLVNGRRYEIYPGTPQYTQAEFESYRLRIKQNWPVMKLKPCRPDSFGKPSGSCRSQ